MTIPDACPELVSIWSALFCAPAGCYLGNRATSAHSSAAMVSGAESRPVQSERIFLICHKKNGNPGTPTRNLPAGRKLTQNHPPCFLFFLFFFGSLQVKGRTSRKSIRKKTSRKRRKSKDSLIPPQDLRTHHPQPGTYLEMMIFRRHSYYVFVVAFVFCFFLGLLVRFLCLICDLNPLECFFFLVSRLCSIFICYSS